MDAQVAATWPINSEDDDGLTLGEPIFTKPFGQIFERGDVYYNGVAVCSVRDFEYQRLNFGRLD